MFENIRLDRPCLAAGKVRGPFHLVGRVALVETSLTTPPQRRVGIPLDHEQRALEASELAEGAGELAGIARGCQPLEGCR